jgi:hypothetical protein
MDGAADSILGFMRHTDIPIQDNFTFKFNTLTTQLVMCSSNLGGLKKYIDNSGKIWSGITAVYAPMAGQRTVRSRARLPATRMPAGPALWIDSRRSARYFFCIPATLHFYTLPNVYPNVVSITWR